MTDETRESLTSHYLDGLRKRALEHGDVEVTITLDAYGDGLITCPFCKAGIWIKPTVDERRKWVFRLPHTCPARKEPVHFHVTREGRSAEEVLGFLNEYDPFDPYEYELVKPKRHTIRHPKR